jgi:beta-lactamase regulating signal transducer with metallopeptidase domain
MIPEAFVRASVSLLTHLAEPAARAIALACVAGIVLSAFRVKRVALRLLAWTTVLYGAVTIALVGWLLPGVQMHVPGTVTVERIVEANRTVGNAVETLKAYLAIANTKTVEGRNAEKVKAAGGKADLASAMAARRASQTATLITRAMKNEANLSSTSQLEQAFPPRTTHAPSAPAYVPSASGSSVSQLKRPPAIQRNAGLNAAPFGAKAAPEISWAVVAAGIYGAISFLLLARLLLGIFLSRRLSRLAEPIRGVDAVRKLRFRAYSSGLESVPRIAESELVSVPATLNVFRPLILLPSHWREWDDAKFDAILAHEVAHVARRDSLTQRISLIHRAIFWFSPLAWWLDRKLNELAEEASDEAALSAGVDKKQYAQTLLGFFADLEAASGRVWWQGVSMASDGSRAGHAEQRVERILAWGGNISMKKSLAVALVAIAAPVIFLAATVHPVMAQDQTQANSKNVIVPGGPKAPALLNAPKGGVAAPAPVAPAMPPAPQGGVSSPSMPPPPAQPGPGQGIENSGPLPQEPPAPALAPTGPMRTIPTPPTAVTVPTDATVSTVASVAPVAPVAAIAPITPQAGETTDVEEAEAAVRAAQKQLQEVQAAAQPDEAAIHAAQVALRYVEAALAGAREARSTPQDQNMTIINGNFNSGWGPRYVIMSGNSDEVSMSGDEEDLQHARELRKKISGDFIWFERDEKSYIITDRDFIAKAKALFAPEEALAKQQDELGREQDGLGKQQDALGEKMEAVKVKIDDITPELQQVRTRLLELETTGATQEELGRLQSRLGQLQSEVGRFQSKAGAGQAEIGRQQAELGRKQGELGRQQGELGRQQGELAKKASQQLREMFDDAIARGIAKPE